MNEIDVKKTIAMMVECHEPARWFHSSSRACGILIGSLIIVTYTVDHAPHVSITYGNIDTASDHICFFLFGPRPQCANERWAETTRAIMESMIAGRPYDIGYGLFAVPCEHIQAGDCAITISDQALVVPDHLNDWKTMHERLIAETRAIFPDRLRQITEFMETIKEINRNECYKRYD